LPMQNQREVMMNKERILTIRWNNILTVGLGIPTLSYIAYAFSRPLWTTRGGLIGLAILGILY